MEDNDRQYLDEDLTLFPTSIGLLTRLHTLDLYISSYTQAANVDWISQLTSLQDLTLNLSRSHGNELQAAAVLTNLTRLH